MANLKKAFNQLFARPQDEQFEDFDKLYTHCLRKQRESEVHWRLPPEVIPLAYNGNVSLKLKGVSAFGMNDWSFGQACRIAKVKKETLNRLKPDTTAQVLIETMPFGSRPFQVFTQDGVVKSIHGVGYSRLYDSDVLELVIDEAFDFDPPPKGANGATGLYAGEQDMFAFMIDDKTWVDIGGEHFAPGFFIWNSEVGRRSVGIQTFWYQRVCGNHIVWDANKIASYSRKHTANVGNAVDDLRFLLKRLIQTRDSRKDAFTATIKQAMATSLGSTSDDVAKALNGFGIAAGYIKDAVEMMATQSSGYTVFKAVDSLTRITGRISNAGDRAEQDSKVGRLLSMAS